jgi:hypothetical protein
LALAGVLSSASALAASRGLILSQDSAQLYYLSDINDTLLRNSRQQLSLIVAKEQDPRNLLLQADAELLDYQRQVLGTRTLSPKAGLIYGNSHDQDYGALLAGAILRQPPSAERHHEWLVELFLAPHLGSHKESGNEWRMDFEWTWGFRIQVNYPLPDQAELNLGFRKIEVDLHERQPSSFETGLFFGLSYRF